MPGQKGNPGNKNPSPETRWKKGEQGFNAKQAGYSAFDVRTAQRHIASQLIDPTDTKAISKLIGKRKMTIAEVIALKELSNAMAGNNTAIQSVQNNLCGKLKETHEIIPLPAEKIDIPITNDPIEAKRILDDVMKEKPCVG